MLKQSYVYIVTNRYCKVLYTGVTSDLLRRVAQHKSGKGSLFTSKYRLSRLVYFESCEDIECAIAREKQIKAGSRRKKVELIEKDNPMWKDLSGDIGL
jgi:putative endonuclease